MWNFVSISDDQRQQLCASEASAVNGNVRKMNGNMPVAPAQPRHLEEYSCRKQLEGTGERLKMVEELWEIEKISTYDSFQLWRFFALTLPVIAKSTGPRGSIQFMDLAVFGES